jgi:hypoxanthine phosphoribosyltransferase
LITGKPFLSAEHIQTRVKELAASISEDYQGKEFLAVGILKGAFMFFSAIVKLINVPMYLDFITTSSYNRTESSGEIKIHCDLREEIRNRDVLLIEDIVHTGITLHHIRNMLLARNPSSLKICALLDKKGRRRVDVHLDYIGYEIPNEYVVGYGLDYDNKFRNLPYISIFKKRT